MLFDVILHIIFGSIVVVYTGNVHLCMCHMKCLTYSDFAPEIQHYALPFMIAMLSFIIPLLFTIVLHIDKKYSAKEFVRFFLRRTSSVLLCILVVVCFCLLGFLISYYNKFLSISFCISVTLLFCSIIWSFFDALTFNNPQKLLDIILKQFKGLTSDKKKEQFYSLSTHLFIYAIKKDINFLYDIEKDFVEKHLIVWRKKHNDLSNQSIYDEKLLNLLIRIAREYKGCLDDGEISSLLAHLYFSLVDREAKIDIGQDTYNALFHALYICINNNHKSLINDFQRLMRYAYNVLKNQNRDIEACRLRLFMLVLNATLYGKEDLACVNDAILHNFDTVIIGDNVILPITTVEAIDLYFWITSVLWDGKEYSYYVFVTSNFASNANITVLHKYIDSYFAYLALKLYREGCEKYPTEWCAYNLDIRQIQEGFKRLEVCRKDVIGVNNRYIVPEDLFSKLRENTNQYILEHISGLDIDVENYLCTLKNNVAILGFAAKLKNVVRFDYYDVIEEGINQIVVAQNIELEIPRSCLIPAFSNACSNGISNVSYKVFEHLVDYLADIYNSFEKVEEEISADRLHLRWLDFMCEDDYCFLSLGVNKSHLTIQPIMGKFSSYFPSQCVIVIRYVDLPIIKWNINHMNITSVKDIAFEKKEDHTIQLPKSIITLDLQISINYKKSTKIHLLKITK